MTSNSVAIMCNYTLNKNMRYIKGLSDKLKIISALIINTIFIGNVQVVGGVTTYSWGDEAEIKPDPEEEAKITKYYEFTLKVKQLGNYNILLESHEIPSHETIPIVGNEHFPSTQVKYITEVDNTKPSAKYSMHQTHKVDIWYNNSHYDKSQAFRQELDTIVSELKSPSLGLDVQFNQIDTYEDKTTVERYTVKYIRSVGSGSLGVTDRDGDVAKKYLSGTSSDMTINIPKMREDGLDAVNVNISMYIYFTQDEEGRWVPTNPENRNDWTNFAGYEVKINNGELGAYKSSTMTSSGTIVNVVFKENNLMDVEVSRDKVYKDIPVKSLRITAENFKTGETPAGQMGAGINVNIGNWVEEERERVVTIQVPTILYTALAQMEWRPDTLKFVIYANHETPEAYGTDLGTNARFNSEVQAMSNYGAYYIGVGSNKNKEDFSRAVKIYKNIKPNDKECAMFTNGDTSLESSAQEIKRFILSKVPIQQADKNWILVDTDVKWETTYDDYEKDIPLNILENEYDIQWLNKNNKQVSSRYTDDKILAEKWRYRHNTIYDNSNGLLATNNIWIENPITTFKQVGLYRINYKRKDNPIYPDMNRTNGFDKYRYWSEDYDYRLAK